MKNFKAYLTIIKGSKESQEIRKFTMDYEVASSFYYLKEKIQCVFPILYGKKFTITWKDIEGDSITISSDEELYISFHESPESTYHRLYITLQLDESKDFQPDVSTIHRHIICDACNKNIYGFRYKCIECADFDLCFGCEGKGLHPEHYMLRIAEPTQWSSRHVKRLAYLLKKFIKNAIVHTEREEVLREYPIMKGRHHSRHGPNSNSTSMMETVVGFLQSPSYAEECPIKFNDPNPPETATEATASCNKPQSQKMKTEENKPVNLFKVVEDTIAPVLNQLGINISMKVMDDLQSNSKANNAPTNQTDTKEASNKNKKSDSKPYDDSTSQPDSTETQINNEKSSTSNNASTNEADAKEAPIINDKSGKSSDDDDWTIVNKEEKSVNSNASGVAKILHISSNSLESTNENKPQETVTPSAPKNEPSNGNLYPLLPQPTVMQPNLYHPNPNIQAAIITMLDMGFSNDGGWLTQLLVAENGNINKVLDKLSPVRM